MNLPPDKSVINRPIRIALVGCGRISKKHIEAIQNHKKDLELVAVCDTNQDILDEVSSKFNVTSFSTLSDALSSSAADLFVICHTFWFAP